MEIKVKLMDTETKKVFYKYFKTEFEKDKFINKIKYSSKLIILDECRDYDCD